MKREEARRNKEKRIRVKIILKQQLESRIKQLKLMEELILPLKDNIKLLNQVIINREPLEKYIEHSKYVNDYYKDIIGDKIK